MKLIYKTNKKTLNHYNLGLFKSCKAIRVYMTLNLGRYIQYQTNKQAIDNYKLNKINYISDTSHDTKIFLLPLLGLYINSCFSL